MSAREKNTEMRALDIPVRIYRFYADGFKSMTIGKSLWLFIVIKLILIFLVMKMLFFPNLLEERYDNDTERANAVMTSILSDNQQGEEN